MSKQYIVIDLEFAKVSRSMKKTYGSGSEIIQIGAVLVDEEYTIIDKFQTFVAPVFGKLTSTIANLTGISKADLADAPDICTALKDFSAWIPDNGDIEFVSWSDNDQKQLNHELAFNNIEDPKLDHPWRDCQVLFGDFMGEPERKYGLQYVLCITDLDGFDENEHNALSDAYNTALLFAGLKSKTLQFSKYFRNDHESDEKTACSCTLGDLFSEMLAGCA